jgi:Protein of unknown function (DUF2510)
MTASIEPGWYDDPEDAQGQRYWDGQQWTRHRHPKPISQPPPPTGKPAQSAPPPPPPGTPPSPYQQARLPLPGGGPPQKSRTRMIAAVVGAAAVLAVIGWLALPSSSSPSKTGNQDSPDAGHTNSYQTGYQWAHANNQRYSTAIVLQGAHAFCAETAKSEAPVDGLNEQEWTQGCEDAWQKMGYTQPSSSVDCSKPENLTNGHCF